MAWLNLSRPFQGFDVSRWMVLRLGINSISQKISGYKFKERSRNPAQEILGVFRPSTITFIQQLIQLRLVKLPATRNQKAENPSCNKSPSRSNSILDKQLQIQPKSGRSDPDPVPTVFSDQLRGLRSTSHPRSMAQQPETKVQIWIRSSSALFKTATRIHPFKNPAAETSWTRLQSRPDPVQVQIQICPTQKPCTTARCPFTL